MRSRFARALSYGVATFIPGVYQWRDRRNGGGSTHSARYCYSVWMRHLVRASNIGLQFPGGVLELGPGDSLGVGLAAVICGVDQYFGLDHVPYTTPEFNRKIFDELVIMFRERMPIPGDDEFPGVSPKLLSYDFPAQILTDEKLEVALVAPRLERLREALEQPSRPDSPVQYIAPWMDRERLSPGCVDMVMSQAVLHHIEDLPKAYRLMRSCLRPRGCLSHVLDYSCVGLANTWDGHWAYSDIVWRMIRGRRAYSLNREPHSTYKRLLRQYGFTLVGEEPYKKLSQVPRRQLARRFQNLSDDDLTTAGAFLQAVATNSES